MSASDGYVVGVTKVVDHGPESSRWDLVIVGDGYRASELTNYHTHVQSFIDQLRTTPPFNELFCGINVHRIDVVSTDSGADDPGCGGNPAVTAKTYFDATFCSMFAGSPLERLLTIDDGLALSVANTLRAAQEPGLVHRQFDEVRRIRRYGRHLFGRPAGQRNRHSRDRPQRLSSGR